MTTPHDDEPVLPDRTSDEDPRSWGEDPGSDSNDERLLRDVPPHHA